MSAFAEGGLFSDYWDIPVLLKPASILLWALQASCSGSPLRLPPNRSPSPVHERFHLLQREFAVFVGIHGLENSFMGRLKLLQ